MTDFTKLTDAELVDVCRDRTQDKETLDAAWKEADKRRERTMHLRHSADDEPES